MNYLAHIYLARFSDAAMVGALLGDFAKADVTGRYAPEVAREIILHRQIDSYTDQHPVVQEALAMFPDGRRRYAGIILDVFYDHLLSQRWSEYSTVPREQFIARFYAALDQHQAILPERLSAIVPYMVSQDWLGRYASMDGVRWAIERISGRLSKNGDLLRAGLVDLHQHQAALAAGFDIFFPDLIAFAASARERLADVTFR